MPIITEVHSICAAPNWVVDLPSGGDSEPAVCFALVSTVSPQYSGAGTAREVVPIPASALMTDLIGRDTGDFASVGLEAPLR